MKIANILAVAGLCATGLAQTDKVKISKLTFHSGTLGVVIRDAY